MMDALFLILIGDVETRARLRVWRKPRMDEWDEIRGHLLGVRDELLSTLRTWLSIKIMIKDIDGFKDFIKYVNRYIASEVQFLIEEHGFKSDIETIIEKIESSHFKENDEK